MAVILGYSASAASRQQPPPLIYRLLRQYCMQAPAVVIASHLRRTCAVAAINQHSHDRDSEVINDR